MALALLILKITGITIALILALALILLLIILFVPVRFELKINIPETDFEKEDFSYIQKNSFGKLYVHWLFSLVRACVIYKAVDDDGEVISSCVKAAWVTIFPKKEKNRTSAEKDKRKKKSEEKSEENSDGGGEINTASEETENITEMDTIPDDEKESVKSENADEEINEEAVFEDLEDPKISGFIEFMIKVFSFLSKIFCAPYEVFLKIRYTISRIYDKISTFYSLFTSEIFDRARVIILGELGKILRALKPRSCNIKLVYGTGDPALTAYSEGVLGVLYPYTGGFIEAYSDFDKEILALDLKLKGRITIFRILRSFAKVYFNKDVRRFINRFNYAKSI